MAVNRYRYSAAEKEWLDSKAADFSERISLVAERFLQQFPEAGASNSSVQQYLGKRRRNLQKSGLQNDHNQAEEPEEYRNESYGLNSMSIDLRTRQPVRTLDDLIRVCEVDTSIWEVVSFESKAWTMGSKNSLGNPQRTQLYSVSAKFRPIHVLDPRRQVAAALDAIAEMAPRKILPPRASSVSETPATHYLSLYLPDVHLGKLAWAPESGEDYDTQIASNLMLATAADLVDDAWRCFRPEVCILPIGSDFVNSDNRRNTTTAGTPQSADTRFQKVFLRAVEVLQELIETVLFKRKMQVQVVQVPGNHDEETTFFIYQILQAMYRHMPESRIQFSSSIKSRQYVQAGKTLIGYAHGDSENHSELPMIMAKEAQELFAVTTYHEWHLGHHHRRKQVQHTSVLDRQGTIIETVESLSSADAWHYKKGYVGANRGAQAFIYHSEHGRRAVLYRNAAEYAANGNGPITIGA